MKHIQKKVMLHPGCDLHALTGSSHPLFLDIETTGLSPERNHIYLIGCCYPLEISSDSGGGTWEFHQWFSQGPEDEPEILRCFADFLSGFESIVHFNGDTFDLPFLHRRAQKYRITEEFLTKPGIDILKLCRKLKRLLNVPNVKLKTLETFLGLAREDLYNGGQLIEIYRNYVKAPDPEAEHLLLLHNEEDILGMPEMLPILSYHCLLTGLFHVIASPKPEISDTDLRIALTLDRTFPQPVYFREEPWSGLIRGDSFHLTVPLHHGECRLYFPNYKDYYYLPEEDMAIHKSVAEFVDKDHRKKATKDTAYIRHTGDFLPVPGHPGEDIRIFHDTLPGQRYVELSTAAEADSAFWDFFLHRLVSLLI